MYTEFFGLSCLPFSNTPDPRFFFKTPEHEEALARMQYCLAYHKGMLAVTGQAGTGKTLLTRLFLTTQPHVTNVALVLHPQLSSNDLLREIAREFGVNSSPTESTSVLAARLQEFLIGQKQRGQNPLVIIDESHTIPAEGYDALRILSNLEVADSKLVDIFLFGQGSLQRNLMNPSLHQLHQRLFSSVQLKNLTEEQTIGYINFRLQCAGVGDEPIFEPDAIRRIYKYSGGLPRLINQACDNCLLTAFSAESKTVTFELVQEVIEQIIGMGGMDPTSFGSGIADNPDWAVGQNAAYTGGSFDVQHSDGAARARVDTVLAFFDRKEGDLKTAVAQLEERLSHADSVMSRLGLSNESENGSTIEQIEAQVQRIEGTMSDAASLADRLANENDTAHVAAEKLSQASGSGDECTDKIHAAAEQSGHLLTEKAEDIADRTQNLLTELENRRADVGDQADALESKVEEAQSTRQALEASVVGLTDRQTQAGQVLAELADISGQSENLVLTMRGNLEDIKEACDQSWSAANEAKQATDALAGVTAEAIDAQCNAQDLVDRLPGAERLLEAMQTAQIRGAQQIETLQETVGHADEQITRFGRENDRAETTFQSLYDVENRAKETAEVLTRSTSDAIKAQQDVRGLLEELPDVQGTIDAMQAAQDRGGKQIETQQEIANQAETQITRFAQENERADATLRNLAGATDRGDETTGALQRVTAEANDAQDKARGLLNHLPEAQDLLEAMQAAQDRGAEQIETQQEIANHAETQITRFAQENDSADAALQELTRATYRGDETTYTLQRATAEANDAHDNARGLLNHLPEAQDLLGAMQAAHDRGAEQIETQQETANYAETQITRFVEESERAETARHDLSDMLDRTETAVGQAAEAEQRLPNLIVEAAGLLDQLPMVQSALAMYAEIEGNLDKKLGSLVARLAEVDDRLATLENATQQAQAIGESLAQIAEQAQTAKSDLDESVDRAHQKDDQLTVTAQDAETQRSQISEIASQADQIRTKLSDELQVLRRERTTIRDAVKASHNVLRQVADTDKILHAKLENNRAQQFEAHQQTAAIKKQLEDIKQHAEGLEQIDEKLQSMQATVDDTAAQVQQLDKNVETARSEIVAILAEPDRILASIKTQIDRMLQIADVTKKVHASISKASLNANRQLHSFRDLTSALDERMQKLSLRDPALDVTRGRTLSLHNRLSTMTSRSTVIKKSLSDRTPPAFTRDDTGLIAEASQV